MNKKDMRIQELEELILNTLLPIYDRYYDLVNKPKPELFIKIEKAKKLPILLQDFKK